MEDYIKNILDKFNDDDDDDVDDNIDAETISRLIKFLEKAGFSSDKIVECLKYITDTESDK